VLDELQRRNDSPATTRGYILAIKQFADDFGKSPERLGGDEIRQFETYLLRDKKLAPGTVEGRMAGLRFLYKKTLKRRDIAYADLIFPKTPRKLPVVLSPEEVSRRIEAAPNLMPRTILMVLYATGIRRTEPSLLQVSAVDSERMVIPVRQGKGSRDRDVPMTTKRLAALREYWRWKRPQDYLFPSTQGQRGIEQPISDHTIWYICSEAAKRAGINRNQAADGCTSTPPQLRDNPDGIRNRPADDPASDGPCAPGTYHPVSPHVAAPPARRTQPAGSDQRP